MNTFTLGACFQHELHTGPYFMTFAPRLYFKNEKSDKGLTLSIDTRCQK